VFPITLLGNSERVDVVEKIRVYGVNTLSEAVGLLTGQLTLQPVQARVGGGIVQNPSYKHQS
jgi:hypothetical protein